jgi:autotransporter-associated beta strand protein
LNSILSVPAGNFVFAQPVVAGTGSFATVFNATVVNSINAATTGFSTAGFNGNMVISTPVTVRINGGTVSGTGSIFMDTSGALFSISGGSASAPLSSGISVPVILNRNNSGGLNNGEGNPFTANFGANGGTSTGTGTFLTFSWRDTLAINSVISGASDVNFGAAANGNSSDGVAGGDGIVFLNNSMTYTGATRITTGTFPNNGNTAFGQVSNSPSWGLVRLGMDNALPPGTTLTWGKGAQNQQATIDAGALDLFGRSQTVKSIAVGQGVNNVGGITNFSNEATGTLLNATGTLIITGNAQTSFTAPIGALTDGFDNTGAQRMGNDFIAIQLSSAHTGSLQLAHSNTYIGGTTIGGGTLSLGDPAALGFGSKLPINKVVGSTTVNGPGKLDLGGQTINEPITLNGGTLTSSGGATVNNGIKGVGFTATGSNIAGDATIAFSGSGSGANATPLLAATKSSFTLTNGGSGYTAVPRIQISGGNGTGALATALMGLTSASVGVANAGSGYISAPTVTFNLPTGGVAATGHTTIDGSGHVTAIIVDTPGKGYTGAATVTLGAAPAGGTNATANSTFTNLLVTDFNLTNGGTGFNSAPSITFINAPVSGTSATATSDNFHFTLVGIQQTDAGSGYVTSSATFASSGTLASGVVLTPVTIPTITLQSNSFIGGDSDISLPVAINGAGGFTKFGSATVDLGGSNSFLGTTTVSAGTLKLSNANALQNSTANLTGSGSVVFNGSVVGPYTFGGLSGTNALALLDSNSNPVIVQVGNNNSNTTYGGVLSGGGGITKIGTGTTTLTGANNYGGTTTVKAGRLELGASARTPVLSGAGSDIQAGRIIFDYSGATIAGTINGLVATSKASNFTSGQFRSSTADASHGLGVFDDGASQVSVAYTYYGDANDDGRVNALDFNALASNFGLSGKFWYQGDFDYSGNVNTLDFNLLSANFNKSPIVTAPSLGALVPEPASIGLIGVAGMMLVRRRRA